MPETKYYYLFRCKKYRSGKDLIYTLYKMKGFHHFRLDIELTSTDWTYLKYLQKFESY